MRGGGRFPDLEDAAEAHEHHGIGQPGIFNQIIRQHDAPFPVGLHSERIGIQRGGHVVVFQTEKIEPVQRLRELFENRLGPSLDAVMLVRGPQHEMGTVAAIRRFQGGTKRRGNGHAALGVELVLMGAQKVGHPRRAAFLVLPLAQVRQGSPCHRGGGRLRPCSAVACRVLERLLSFWDGMG